MIFFENNWLKSVNNCALMKYALNKIVFSFQVFKYQQTRSLKCYLTWWFSLKTVDLSLWMIMHQWNMHWIKLFSLFKYSSIDEWECLT